MSVRILLVVHDFLPESVGGTEILVARLAAEISRQAEVAVFCTFRARQLPQNRLVRDSFAGIDLFKLVQNYPYRVLRETLIDPGAERVFARVLRTFRPDVVHFHHLAFLPLRLPFAAASHGAATVFTLHDYYLACPSGGQRTAHPDGVLCDLPPASRCAECYSHYRHREGGLEQLALRLGALPLLPPGWPFRVFGKLPRGVRRAIKHLNPPGRRQEAPGQEEVVIARQRLVRQLFEKIDLFISPSQFLADWAATIGLSSRRVTVVRNPAAPDLVATSLPPLPPAKLVFVGTPAPHKGLLQVVRSVSHFDAAQVRLEVCGDLDMFPRYTTDVRREAGPNVQFSGACPPATIGQVLVRNHVLVLASSWPENAPLTILEAHACGRPVIASRVGGIPEYVRDRVDGLLFDPARPHELDEILERLVSDPALLPGLAAGIRPPETVAAFARRMMDLYEEVLGSRMGGAGTLHTGWSKQRY